MIAMTATSAHPEGPRSPTVVDTSVWIECFSQTALGQRIAAALPAKAHCIVPTIVQLELSKWALRELTEAERERLEQSLEDCQVELLDSETAALAAQANVQHKLATADAVIYATALRLGAEVLTCDAHFRDLPLVRLFAKGSAAGSATSASEPTGRWDRWSTAKQLAPTAQ